jgi:hypothetical protein
VFVDTGKNMVRERLRPGLLDHFLLPFGKKSELVKKGYLLSGIRDKGHGTPHNY